MLDNYIVTLNDFEFLQTLHNLHLRAGFRVSE